MIQFGDACRRPLNEAASGLCQPDAPRVALEQEDAKIFLQRFHTGTYARQADAERVRCMAKVQIFGNG
jgi:hypothetical protein